jgi:hypothetical protein
MWLTTFGLYDINSACLCQETLLTNCSREGASHASGNQDADGRRLRSRGC